MLTNTTPQAPHPHPQTTPTPHTQPLPNTRQWLRCFSELLWRNGELTIHSVTQQSRRSKRMPYCFPIPTRPGNKPLSMALLLRPYAPTPALSIPDTMRLISASLDLRLCSHSPDSHSAIIESISSLLMFTHRPILPRVRDRCVFLSFIIREVLMIISASLLSVEIDTYQTSQYFLNYLARNVYHFWYTFKRDLFLHNDPTFLTHCKTFIFSTFKHFLSHGSDL